MYLQGDGYRNAREFGDADSAQLPLAVMKRILGQAFVVLAAATTAIVVTPACTENNQSIFIRSIVAPPVNRQNGSCVYTPDPAAVGLFRGVVDVVGMSRGGYTPVLLVGGQLMARGDTLNVRAEPNRSNINGAVVRVTDPNGATLKEFTATGTGFVDVGTGAAPGFGLFAAVVLDYATADAVTSDVTSTNDRRQVIANVKVFGKTLGGVDLESGEYQLPIDVCRGCLVVYADDPASATRAACDGEVPENQAAPCQAGADEGYSCRQCAGDVNSPATGFRGNVDRVLGYDVCAFAAKSDADAHTAALTRTGP